MLLQFTAFTKNEDWFVVCSSVSFFRNRYYVGTFSYSGSFPCSNEALQIFVKVGDNWEESSFCTLDLS